MKLVVKLRVTMLQHTATINETSHALGGTGARLSPQHHLLKKGCVMANSHPIPTSPLFQDIAGARFGQLIVMSYAGKNQQKKSLWTCRCDCGRVTTTVGTDLRRGRQITCGSCHCDRSDQEYEAWIKRKLATNVTTTPGGCCEWRGDRYRDGYGRIVYHGTQIGCHILAYRLFRGNTSGLCVLHRCDNPPCCNPDHLFLGTRADNVADMVAKGRHGHGERARSTKLTVSAVLQIRERYLRGLVSQRDLAAEYGVTQMTICRILNNRTWKHEQCEL